MTTEIDIKNEQQRLEQLKKQHGLQRQKEQLQWQVRREKFEPVTRKLQVTATTLKQVESNFKPYAKKAYTELKPGVKAAAHSIGQGVSSYLKHVAYTPSQASFVLTPKGRTALQSYRIGNYSIIPPNSIRAELLSIGSFTLGGAVNMYGDNGAAAAQILAEQGLIARIY